MLKAARLCLRRTIAAGSGRHRLAEIVDSRLGAALAVGDAERNQADLDHRQGAEDHGRVDMAHMGDADRLALQIGDPAADHHAAFLVAILEQRLGVATPQYVGYRIGALGGIDDVE